MGDWVGHYMTHCIPAEQSRRLEATKEDLGQLEGVVQEEPQMSKEDSN